jgi:hypothetical protein
MKIDGNYLFTYTGAAGQGHGGLTIIQGTLAGVAYGPVRIGGTVEPDASGTFKLTFVLHALEDLHAVTGEYIDRGDRPSFEGQLSLAAFEDGEPFRMNTETGPIDVRLEKVRAL